MLGEQQHTVTVCVTDRMAGNVQGLKRNWIEYECFCVCPRACTCYQCLTGGRLWLLFSGTVQDTNDISTPKGGGRQICRSRFEELKTQLYRKGEVVCILGCRGGQKKHTTENNKDTEINRDVYKEKE